MKRILLIQKSNTTKFTTNKLNKNTNKSIIDLKNKDTIKVKGNKIKTIKKDLLELKNGAKNNKIKTI